MTQKRLLISLLVALFAAPLFAEDISTQFSHPPASARPWVYWFWNNGNVTKAGITADLEAMKRAGVGGVIIMDVAERFAPPRGTADFMNPEWQDLFCFAVAEAHRLGIEINMTNGPGWCGSSGPWISSDLSMQMLVSTNITVTGPSHVSTRLPQPKLPERHRDGWDTKLNYAEYYRDIAVLAYPNTGGYTSRDSVVDLTAHVDADGILNWNAPAGNWTIQRIGHTSTGSSTRPPVAGGNGLECDKLSRKAMDVQFANMIDKLARECGTNSKALVATHIDSWEVGSQNWTLLLRKEFKKRRGYDPTPFLPNAITAGTSIGDPATAARFTWDFNETIAELLAQNYTGRLAELAHTRGMRLTLEGYDLPFGDEATYTAPVDEPMSEFWTQSSSPVNLRKGRQMASVGHIYGRTVIGAESFTSGDGEKWMLHPALIKSLGDFEFCQGINRFVIHRYAHQPYLDRAPGATMGPWGLHYERTQTWWELSSAWHEYLARCQFMLRQGKFVADLCYLRPESPMQTYFTAAPEPPAGYKYDECSAQALEERMKVQNGQLVLPDGMSYQLLVLPPSKTMTPALARKLHQLVEAGATVLVNGPKPETSPSLADFPKCDARVITLTGDLWGDCDGAKVTEHAFGKGRLIWGQPIASVLKSLGAPADFVGGPNLNWIHRHSGQMDIYFVANPTPSSIETACRFRVKGEEPELWNPETGEMSSIPACQTVAGGLSVPLHFEPTGSLFLIFRKHAPCFSPVMSFERDGVSVYAQTEAQQIQIQKAIYGIPGDPQRTRDVKSKLQALVDGGTTDFQVSEMAHGDDPALNIVKTLTVSFTVNGQAGEATGHDPEVMSLATAQPVVERVAELRRGADGQLKIVARQPGQYQVLTADNKRWEEVIANVPAPHEISGPWEVGFPPHWGAPDHITLEQLCSWSDSSDAGVKFFSGTATYTKTFDWDGGTDGALLNLGDVQVMAEVKLNGCDLGIVWKAPFRVKLGGALRKGSNSLEIRVANLWPNRLIGDAALPEANRLTWSSWEPFKKDMPLLKSGLLGPVTIESTAIVPLP